MKLSRSVHPAAAITNLSGGVDGGRAFEKPEIDDR